MSQPKECSSPTPRSALGDKLMEFSRADGVLAVRGLQAALIDAAIALDDAATKLENMTKRRDEADQAVGLLNDQLAALTTSNLQDGGKAQPSETVTHSSTHGEGHTGGVGGHEERVTVRSTTALRAEHWRDPNVTVPCDGDNVLGVWGIGTIPAKIDISVVHYYSGRWHEPDDDEDDYRPPDFWMPLPSAPTDGKDHG